MRRLLPLAVLALVAVLTASSAAAAEPGAQERGQRSARAPVPVAHTVRGPQAALVLQCKGDGCNGKRSADYGCDDDRLQIGGFTTTSNGHPATDVIMWYSYECQAVWGTYDAHGPDANPRRFTLQCLDQYNGQPDPACDYLEWVTGHVATPMGGWNHSLQVCVDLSVLTDDLCTGWR